MYRLTPRGPSVCSVTNLSKSLSTDFLCLHLYLAHLNKLSRIFAYLNCDNAKTSAKNLASGLDGENP